MVARFAGLWVAGSVLAACVSSGGGDSNLNVQSLTGLNGETDFQSQQASLAEEGEFTDQTGTVVVPTKAPRDGLLVAALSDVAKKPENNPANEKTTTTPLSSDQTAKPFFKKPASSSKMALLSDGVSEQPKRKTSFFQSLFKRSDKKKPSRAASRSRSRSGGATLPGVKSNASLFGIGGEDREEESKVQLASVGGLGRISPNGLRLQHSKVQVSCFKPELMRLLKKVHRKFGKRPIVTSGYRSPKRNRRAGGVSRSLHIYCKAADIQVENVSKWTLAKYLRTLPGRGGVGTYCRTKSVHIDVGSKRDWHHPCRRSSRKKRRS